MDYKTGASRRILARGLKILSLPKSFQFCVGGAADISRRRLISAAFQGEGWESPSIRDLGNDKV